MLSPNLLKSKKKIMTEVLLNILGKKYAGLRRPCQIQVVRVHVSIRGTTKSYMSSMFLPKKIIFTKTMLNVLYDITEMPIQITSRSVTYNLVCRIILYFETWRYFSGLLRRQLPESNNTELFKDSTGNHATCRKLVTIFISLFVGYPGFQSHV